MFPTHHVTLEDTAALNQQGDNLQDKCSWIGYNVGWSPGALDNVLMDISGTAPITSVPSQFRARTIRAFTEIYFKNMFNSRCDVTLYKLWPKDNITAIEASVLGKQVAGSSPVGALETWAGLTVLPGTAFWGVNRRPTFNEHNFDIFTTPAAERYFIRVAKRWYLEPGEFKKVTYTHRRSKVISKGAYGSTLGLGSLYTTMKGWGCVYLFRVQGSLVHSKSTSETGVPYTDKDLGTTMGEYNVEFYRRRIFHYCSHSNRTDQHSMGTNALPTMTQANEIIHDVNQPQIGPAQMNLE